MSNHINLDEIEHNGKESESDSLQGLLPLAERAEARHKIQNGYHSRGGWVINNLSAVRRVVGDRLFRGDRGVSGDSPDIVSDGDKTRDHVSERRHGVLLSGTAYCLSSCSMILLNKIVLSSYGFNAGTSLMFYQNFISTIVVVVLSLLGAVSVEKFTWKLVKLWIPVNLIFIGMLVSSMYSLKYINVAMVTILKNMTNILTAIGEVYLFRKHQNRQVWFAMFLMIISAVSAGITDMSFDARGYAWQTLNCILTASYSLTLRRVMDKAKQLTKSGNLNEISMVLLNNMLSLPFGMILILMLGEWDYILQADVMRIPMFWIVATASGLLGLAISFTSMWFLHQTGPTTYSLVGSLNKIPLSVAGILLFNVPISLPNSFSIIFGLFAGVVFAQAKMSSR